MRIWRKSMILTVALLVFGAARLPFEAGLGRELRAAGLFPQPLEISTLDRIGQTSSAVALGGLRTLVATFLNLRAFTFFTEQRWAEVGDTFDMIVNLAPRTGYYWETGAWHQAYNAASYYVRDSKLPPLRRREAWRASIMRGCAFLERGIRNNPDSWQLPAYMGFILSDANKFPAFRNPRESFAAAAEAYQRAENTGRAPGHVRRARFYALARVEGREPEALALGRKLYAEGRKNHLPTLLLLLLALEAHENPSTDTARRAVSLFGSPQEAYAALSLYWQRTRERFPVYGVAPALESLEAMLSIPAEKSILNTPPPPPTSLDDLFSE